MYISGRVLSLLSNILTRFHNRRFREKLLAIVFIYNGFVINGIFFGVALLTTLASFFLTLPTSNKGFDPTTIRL